MKDSIHDKIDLLKKQKLHYNFNMFTIDFEIIEK